MHQPTVSIIILTKNPGRLFKNNLNRIFTQQFKDFEVIIIDSSSTDGSLDSLQTLPIKLITIQPSSFGHGKTRNLGCTLSKGKYLVFLTQDALPKDEFWLKNLLDPFKDQRVAATFGRQVPKKQETILDQIFMRTLYPDTKIVWESGKYSQGDNIFSNANSAVRRDLLIRYPYHHNIIVSEDYQWANRIMRLGYKIVYQPEATVIHSHTHTLKSLFKRNFDIGVSYRLIDNFANHSQFILKGTKILFQEIKTLQKLKKLHLFPELLVRDLIRFTAINIGKNEAIFPKSIKKKYLSAQEWYWG